MEQEQREREEERHRQAQEERLRAEAEQQLNEGARYLARLRPYPSSRTDDKLELPASALEELERQGVLEKGALLTFAVSLSTRGAGGSTHAGVAEFTAEEGTVGVPPRVALCLTKGSGLDTLDAVGQVEIRYVKLPRCRKSRVVFQPRGEGFHAGGMKVVSLDLEHVLLETLRGHTALTQGDWLPIRHQGQTYELMVRELEPETEMALIDTDLTVEALLSRRRSGPMFSRRRSKARRAKGVTAETGLTVT
ncbi:Ubiquitin fusion degradation protein 1 homolog (UB fusion protein 1) [Durusdinium trenchii]|uniref:Ubiquitin fusion degradation protein 1 homolog (UB fusion protein 1) n=1 Tax=Durusdinium trenchii TaxID=1381693 RepID=A0ABP0LC04_9DINO